MVDGSALKDIADSVGFFQRLFQITVALALGESFKQFVADESRTSSGTDHVFYDRIPSLLTFISIIIPFFDGMNRYFYFVYNKAGSSLPQNYAVHLLFDSACFLAESSIFFIMSRALRVERVSSFVGYICSLMLVDLLWSYFALLPSNGKLWFIVLDAILLTLMFLTKIYLRNVTAYNCQLAVSIFVSIVNIAILIAGYSVSWEFYFPRI